MIALILFRFLISGEIYILWNQMDQLKCKKFIGDTTSRRYIKNRILRPTHWIWLIIIFVSFIIIIFFNMELLFPHILLQEHEVCSRQYQGKCRVKDEKIGVKMKQVKAARKIFECREKEETWYECLIFQFLGILCIKLKIAHIYIKYRLINQDCMLLES